MDRQWTAGDAVKRGTLGLKANFSHSGRELDGYSGWRLFWRYAAVASILTSVWFWEAWNLQASLYFR